MSTILPASLVQSAESTVYLTGVWLDRVLAVYVAGESLNFTVWLGTVDTATSVVSAANAVSSAPMFSINGGSITALLHGGDGQPAPQHRFHVLQSSPGVDACSDGTVSCVANITLQGSDNSVLMFTAPVFNLTGYLPLVITFNNSVDAPPAAISDGSFIALKNWTGSDWMYYTAVQCDTGMIVGLYCEPCPTGGYCPGGGRVWPLPGYWSFSETSVPVPCVLPQACPGALSDPTFAPDGTRFTEVCADGYTSQYCGTCADGYYSAQPRCLSCGLESAELMELVALVVIAFVLFLSLSVAVATASANQLSTAVSAVLVVQHLSVVGKLAAQQVPASLTWLVQAFSVLSMLNFDIQFIKPGCVVGELSFLTVYWCTVGLMLCVSALFVVASGARALLSRRAEERDRVTIRAIRSDRAGLHWQWRFRARLIHSHLILGSILYLRLTTMGFQAINCTNVLQSDGSYERLLSIDLTTRCYEGVHLYSAPFIWLLLVVGSLGFPALCFWLLYRSFHGSVRTTVQPYASSSAFGSPATAPMGSPIDAKKAGGGDTSREPGVEMSKLDITARLTHASQSPTSGKTLFLASHHVKGVKSISSQALFFARTPTARRLSGRWEEQATSRGESVDMQATRSPVSSASWDSPQHFARSPTVTVADRVGQHTRHRTATELAAAFARSALATPQWRKVSESTKQLYRQLGKDNRRQETLGYMYRQLKGELYFFRLLFFATSFGFAAVSVLPSNPTLRLFLTGVFLVFDLFTTCALLPFETWWRNVLSVVLSWLTVVQMFVMLALVQLGLSTDGSSSVDLGHSTTAQHNSDDPNSSLTGDSNAAAKYELYLGVEVIFAMVAIAYVHRDYVKRALRWTSAKLVQAWRLSSERLIQWSGLFVEKVRHWSGLFAERLRDCKESVRGMTRVTRYDVRPRLADESSQQGPIVVSDEAALAMVVLGAVQKLRQADDQRSADRLSSDSNVHSHSGEEDGTWARNRFDYIQFSTPRQSGSSRTSTPTSSANRLNRPYRDPGDQPVSPYAPSEVEAHAVDPSVLHSARMATQQTALGVPLPMLTLPSDSAEEGHIDVAFSPSNVSGLAYAISPRTGRTFNISRQPSARLERASPKQSPRIKIEPYTASSHTRTSSRPHTLPPLSPHTAPVCMSPSSRRAVSPLLQLSPQRALQLRETHTRVKLPPLPSRVLEDGTRVVLTRR